MHKQFYKKTTSFIRHRPLVSFAVVFILLIALLAVGKLVQKPPAEKPKQEVVKTVKVYSIGESPKAEFQAKIEKSGVVKIVAQSSGIVQNITVHEGDKVWRGQNLISLATNYQGGNAGSVQRQIAQTQYQNSLDTFDPQKESLQKQRDIANLTGENNQNLRDISGKSNDETKSLIDANQKQLDQMIQDFDTNPSTTVTQAQINQLQGGIDQLRASQRSLNYQASGDNPPAKLSNLQKDVTLKQLDVQEKALGMGKELSRLQLSLAYVNEATMYPASPFAGVVERVYVHVGQSVNSGTLLAVVTSSEAHTTAVLNVPSQIARLIATGEPSELIIKGKKVAIVPYYVSSEATDGGLYTVFYDVPENVQDSLADGEYISANVPVDKTQASSADPFVPIDAVYQTQDKAFVLVINKDKADTKTVSVGEVFGGYVEVLGGLSSGTQVILDRNVVAQDKVKIY